MATVPRPAAASAAPTAPAMPLTGGAVDGAGSRNQQRGKRGDGSAGTNEVGVGGRSVGEFVEASFASFERAFPGSSATSAAANGSAKAGGSEGSSKGGGDDQLSSEDGAVAATEGSFADEDDEDEDDALLDRASFLTLLTTLYLPLLLLWLRRSMFGTASLLRSLLIGHALRLLLAYAIVLPDAPPAWAADLGARVRKSIMWRHVVGLGVFLADAILGPEDGGGSGLGGSEARHNRGSETWPPPALTALAVITVLAFVVHPDGLTWVVLGKIRDGIRYSFDTLALGFDMIQDGTIPTLAASGSLAGLALLLGILHRTLTSKNKSHAPAPNPERSRQKGKKGKKGRGRHGGGGASRGGAQARGRGRIRGGHYRSTKELANSPPRKVSRSRSRSPSASPPPLAETELRNRIESDSTISVLQESRSQQPSDNVGSTPLLKEQPQSAEVQFGGHLKETPPRRGPDKPATQGQTVPTKKPLVPTAGGKRGPGTDGHMHRRGHESSGKPGGPSGGGRSGRRRRRGKKGPKHGACADKGAKQDSKESLTAMGGLPHRDGLPHSPPPPSSVVIAPPKSAQNSCLPGVSHYVQSFATEPTPPPSPQLTSIASPSYHGEGSIDGGTASSVASACEGHASATMSFFSSASPTCLPTNQIALHTQRRLQPIGSPTPQLPISGHSFQAAPGPSQPLYRSVSMPTEQHGFYGFTNSSPEPADATLHQQSAQAGSLRTTGVIGGNPSALRYNVPNYASTYSYSQGSGRYSPGKIELAAFLAQVGLVGTACAAILEDLSDVDALAQLTKEKFESYQIGDTKQAEISIMLEARRRRLGDGKGAGKKHTWKAAVVRPPPGLENVCPESSRPAGTNATTNGQQQVPFFSSSALSSGTGTGTGTGTTYVMANRNATNPSDSHARCDTGESWASSCDDATKVATPSLSPLPRPFTHVEDSVEEEVDDDSKIEADLQELGGQMAGSILDF